MRELVEAMHGTIALTSRLGEGSTFWFTLTLARQMDVRRLSTRPVVPLTKARVLIVDDNAHSRHILETLVSNWGMRARTAASAEEGLAMLRRAAAAGEAYQIALLDVMMPAVDGIEMARRLKGDLALTQTAVIFVSSVGARAEFAQRLTGLDVAGWLMKPVPQSSLYNELVRVLGDVAALDVTQLRKHEPPVGEALTLPSELNRHVLLAEDNPINQKVAKLQLAKLGLEVDAVINGREAVDAALLRHYDLILWTAKCRKWTATKQPANCASVNQREARAG